MIFKTHPIAFAAISLVIAASIHRASAFIPSNGIMIPSLNPSRGSTNDRKTDHVLDMADNDDWAPSKSAMVGGAGVNNAGEPPFEIRGFSLGNFVFFTGIIITILSFAEYLSDSTGDGLNVS